MLNPFARSMLIDNLTHGFQSRCSVLQFTPATPFDYWLLLNDCSLFDEVTTISVQGCPKANFPITPCLIFFIVLFLWLFTDWWRDPSYCAGIPNSKLWWLLFFIHFFWRVRLWLFITWWYDTNICNGGNILEIWFLLRLFVICAIKLEFSVYHFVPNNLNTMKCSAYYKVFICFDLNMSTWNQFLLELLSCRYWWSNRGFFSTGEADSVIPA